MKRFIYLICAVLLSLTSCDNNQTEGVDASAGERVDAVIKSYVQELASAENGWIATIMTSQGPYRFWMSFTDDNWVTMYTDNTDYPEWRTEPSTTTYNIRAQQRPTLCFDTYSYVAVLCDPDNNISGGTDNQGLQTDFEFGFRSYEDNTFHLVGRMNNVDATLTKATAEEMADAKAGNMMDCIQQIVKYHPDEYLYFNLGDNKININSGMRFINFAYIDSKTASFTERYVYTYTDMHNNIHFFNDTVTVEGVSFIGINWDKDNGTYSMAALNTQTSYPVLFQAEAVIPLDKIFGLDKTYTNMISLPAFYPVQTNKAYLMYAQTAEEIKAILPTYPLGQISMYVHYSDTRKPLLTLAMTFGRYNAGYEYPLTINPDGTMTIGNTFVYSIVAGNAQLLYTKGVTTFVNYLKGKTLRVRWSSAKHPAYQLGEYVNVDDPEWVFIGALFE